MARGSVTKRNGSWGFRVDAGFDPESGTRRQIRRQGFRTKRAAEAALAEFQKTVIDGTVVSASSLRLDDFLDEWLQGQESHLRPTTHHSYVVETKPLKKHLGRYKLQALTPLQIEKFYADPLDHGGRNGGGLAPKTVKNTHVVLRKALADAERLGLVSGTRLRRLERRRQRGRRCRRGGPINSRRSAQLRRGRGCTMRSRCSP
jgi:integrase